MENVDKSFKRKGNSFTECKSTIMDRWSESYMQEEVKVKKGYMIFDSKQKS